MVKDSKKTKKKEEESASESSDSSDDTTPKSSNRMISIVDLVLRFLAAVGVLGSALAMGKSDGTLRIFQNSTQFGANYNDIPTFTFFVVANSMVCVYIVVISIPLSVLNIIKTASKTTRIILVILDTVMLCLLSSGAAATAAIAYLAHNGNSQANWLAFCQQYSAFCSRISGALVGSFGSVLVIMVQIIALSVSISRC